ncbi:MAG: cysteine desulfurase family protein [Chloroflexota bacterium]
MRSRIYLDHAATTPVDPRVVDAMVPVLRDTWGNPSSLYEVGRAARRVLDEARDTVAEVLSCRPNEIVFTSGGSESDNLAIKGVALSRQDRGKHLISTRVEHHAVLHACEALEREHGFHVTWLDVDRHGQVSPADFDAAIRPDTTVASVMLANNEVGTVQPIREIARIARERGVVLHTDAVQAASSLPLNVDDLGVDLLSLSGHKVYGPKGVGVLYVRRGIRLAPQIHGGGQERGLRAGTESVAYAVGMATALRLTRDELETRNLHARVLRDRLIDAVLERVPGARLTGHPTERLPNSASFTFEGADGESVLMNLDQHGICASSGSACSSGSLEVSHVLRAMALPIDQARGSLRLTTGAAVTAEGVEQAIAVLPEVVDRVRAIMPTLVAARD